MPIDGLGSMSMEQLLAMSMMGNGQLTNDSITSSSYTSSDEVNFAFQAIMQNYLEKAKNSVKESSQNGSVDTVVGTAENSQDNLQESVDNDLSELANVVSSMQAVKQIQQKYLAGQNLLDIPLAVNRLSVNYTIPTPSIDYTPSNTSKSELERIYSAVNKASKEYGVDENLIYAIIKQESDFDSTCTSSAGAAGLMQIMPGNFSYLGITNAYDVEQNINGGTKLLKEYLDKYNGNIQMALMAYNGGPGTMQRRGVSSVSDLYKMPLETQNYVPKVMGYYQSKVRS
ncbi:lytic transglycosylase domain-containing protein [Clostridium sp. SM-530-WT-3G]|uniref:lytic transglycosylase domain-containing protein n=1 Tax=Clostridium sp. SM-530-WT-3G TaxID=2725303 RepID=UPI00145DB240|nr:lytic transglycosylase domain-containing protein [Clostridium sp. SM-530-WT-3G]NME83150.1 lytic transglycosylase domain-containing protein [Clostridium sp. SM-530-WT-3G]